MKLTNSAMVTLGVSVGLLAGSASATDFHIAPTGSDAGTGAAEMPFLTLEKALASARAAKTANPNQANRILLHGGEYRLVKPVTITPEDSGFPGKPLIITAAPGETPVLTSAVAITGWKLADDSTPALAKEAHGKVWVADIPKGWRFHFLYADGKSMPVSRLHRSDNFHDWPRVTQIGPVEPVGQLLGVPPGTLDGLPDNGEVEMNLIPVQWWNSLSVIRSFDLKNSTLRRHSKSPTVCDFKDRFIANGGSFNLLNGVKFLTQPGEWAVDSAAGKVYLWPAAGLPANAVITAPTAYRLLAIKGDPLGKATVHDLELRGLTFTCTDRLPEDQWPDAWVKRQAELPDGMLAIEGAADCVIDSCTFTRSGSYAIAFQNYAQDNRVTRNEMGWLGCGGVLLQGFGPGTTDVSKHNVIQRNHIHNTGTGGFMHSAAVTLYQSGCNDISLNWLDQLPYAAIQIAGCHTKEFGPGKECQIWDSYGNNQAMYQPRWEELPQGRNSVFTRATIKPYLHSRDNRITRNLVTNYMAKLGDGGALYCWGCGLGNVWEGNLLRRDQTRPHEELCVALYMDDEVDGATVKDNLCWHVGRPTINKGDNHWANNVIESAKPTSYDSRLAAILAEAAKEGGLPGNLNIATVSALPPDPVAAMPAIPLLANTWIEAAAVRDLRGPRLDGAKQYIGWINGGHSAVFGPFEIPQRQLLAIEIEVGVDPKYAGGKIHVRTAADGPDLATIALESTGSFESWRVKAAPLTLAGGIHPLYFVFEGGQAVCSFKRFRLLDQPPSLRP